MRAEKYSKPAHTEQLQFADIALLYRMHALHVCLPFVHDSDRSFRPIFLKFGTYV